MDQNLLDAQANRKSRSVIEKILSANIAASIITFIVLSYIYRNYDIISDGILDAISFYPERLFITNETANAKIALASSNLFCISYFILHLKFMRLEIIRDKYERQDRKQLLAMLSALFYTLRVWMLYLFAREDGIPVAMVLFPSLTIIAVSMILIRFATTSGETQKPRS